MDLKWRVEEFKKRFLEGDRDAHEERINGLAQDGFKKDIE